MAADAERRLAQARAVKANLETYFENEVSNRDKQLGQLNQELQELKRQLGELRAERTNAEQQNDALQKQLEEQNEEIERLQSQQVSVDSVRREYTVYKAQHEKDLDSRTRENSALKKQIEAQSWQAMELQAQVMDAQKEMSEMQNQEIARAEDFETNAQAKADLTKALSEFEEIFPDMGKNRFVEEYVIAIRNLKAFYAEKEEETRRRESSQVSRGEVPQSSIQDELHREGYDSNTESEGGDYDSDDDPTLQACGLTSDADKSAIRALLEEMERAEAAEASVASLKRQLKEAKEAAKQTSSHPQKLILSNISSIDTEPTQSNISQSGPTTSRKVTATAAQSQQLSLSNISFVENSPVQPVLPQVTLNNPRASETLGFSKIVNMSIAPPPIINSKEYYELPTRQTRFKFSKPVSVETTPVPFEPQTKTVVVPKVTTVYKTPSYTQMWQGAAWHIKIFLISAFVLYMSLSMMLAREYSIWISANDITRQYVFDLTHDHYENLFPSPLIHSIGEYLGIDFTILG